MTRQEVLENHKVDKHGIIQDPGKFEGEMVYAPYFYEASMESGADETVYDYDTPIDIFIISDDDVKEFPELEGVYAVTLTESDSGFVNIDTYMSKEEFDAALEEFEEGQGEDEEEGY